MSGTATDLQTNKQWAMLRKTSRGRRLLLSNHICMLKQPNLAHFGGPRDQNSSTNANLQGWLLCTTPNMKLEALDALITQTMRPKALEAAAVQDNGRKSPAERQVLLLSNPYLTCCILTLLRFTLPKTKIPRSPPQPQHRSRTAARPAQTAPPKPPQPPQPSSQKLFRASKL